MIQQGMTSSFKQQILLGEHDLDTDVIKIALYTSAADLGPNTTVYTTSGEVLTSGTGYTAGGNTLTGASVTLSGATACVTFNNTTWTSVNFTARAALIYNFSKSNKSIAILDFGSDKTSNTNFQIQFPPASSSSAVIRIS
jgi:hypothetical protein